MEVYAYLLRCSDGSYYAGHTDDLSKRLELHQSGILHEYTHSRRPVELVWCEAFESREEAFAAEWRIKGWSRAKKEALIAGNWDRIVELAAIRAPDRAKETSLTMQAARPSRASRQGRRWRGAAGLATG